jgi:hypothetical protein
VHGNNVASHTPYLGVQAKPRFALPRGWPRAVVSLGLCGGCFNVGAG